MIRVVVVEDSRSVRELIVHLLSSDPQIEVVGVAGDGEEAVQCVAACQPDVVTMDVVMPKMDGLSATRIIMSTTPVPIVVVSSTLDPGQVDASFEALEAGAMSAVPKPVGPTSPDFKRISTQLVRTVKLMSAVPVVRRTSNGNGAGLQYQPQAAGTCEIVAIGVSTGGPPVLAKILGSLRIPPPYPILIVQHIAEGFIEGLADWLSGRAQVKVRTAADGDTVRPGVVYLAPDQSHMSIATGGRIVLTDEEARYGMRPSIAVLFDTVRETYGRRALGILLTGMGRDGSEELKRLHDAGGDTIAQDRQSSAVHGMAGHAISIGAARRILTPLQIAAYLDGQSEAQMKERRHGA